MTDFLIFHLYGPMAAWGGPAVGEHRRTDSHPGRSAIIGILAASLGIRRDQEVLHGQLEKAYGLAIRLDCDGELIRDYHTVQAPSHDRKAVLATRRDEITRNPSRLNTLLSQRDYRVDAACTVALWVRVDVPSYSLSELAEALNRPRLTLYLGRKSCPLALPVAAKVKSVSTLAELFSKHKWPWQFDRLKISSNPRCYWDELDVSGMEVLMRSPRRDALISRKRWQFAERQEFMGRLPCKGGQSCISAE